MSTNFLRTILILDATTCVATGALLAGAGALLVPLLGLPRALLQEAGIILLVFAAFVWWASRQVTRQLWPARMVVGVNVAWIAASVALIMGPWVAPTLLGVVFVAAQAAAVAAIAVLQYAALAKLSGPATA